MYLFRGGFRGGVQGVRPPKKRFGSACGLTVTNLSSAIFGLGVWFVEMCNSHILLEINFDINHYACIYSKRHFLFLHLSSGLMGRPPF